MSPTLDKTLEFPANVNWHSEALPALNPFRYARRMNTALKKTGVSGMVVGLGIACVGFLLNAVLGALSPRLAQSFALLIVFGNVMFVLGCINLARAKGQPWYFGLLGLLSCLGLAVLWFLVPDKA